MKKLMTCLAMAAFATLIGFAPVVQAQGDQEGSTFTVTEPLDVGGFVLQPGTYLIKLVLLTANRHVIQVTNADQSQVFANVLSTPHMVREGESNATSRYVYFPEVPGRTKALRTWFARNAENGHDIVYPKQRAMEIAVAVKEPVIAVPDDVKEAELKTVPLSVVTPQQEVQPYEPPTFAAQARPGNVPPTVVAEARPVKPLPKTASDVPLFAALGLLSLGGAFGLRILANRIS